MTGRPLYPDESILWAEVMRTVRPLRAMPVTPVRSATPPAADVRGKDIRGKGVSSKREASSPVKKSAPGQTLDGGWDRRLLRGAVMPDRSIDLHGHTLASAHALLDSALDRAIRAGDRVVLLVTGKPPRPESERPHARGAIRAAIADWLTVSRHAGHIAAVRGAHPRHGGAGALYLILRRARG